MERSNDIEKIASELTDKIIAKMNLIIANYEDTEMVRREVAKRKAKIKETLDNASKKIDEINLNNDLSSDEIIEKMRKVQDSTVKKCNKLQHELDIYLEKQRNVKWSKLQQMRFLYLELGKHLEKNTDFFLNDKLDELSLTEEERKAVYNNDLLLIRDNDKRKKIYQIICKSAAIFLQTGLNKLGIVNSKVHTILEEEGIHHWFIVAQDDDKKQYFLTLAADLPFIKNNFPTEHFATEFPLFDENGNQVYTPYSLDDIRIELGKCSDFCRIINERKEGYGIKHEVIGEDVLREIDTSICYESLYDSLAYANTKVFTAMVSQELENNSKLTGMFIKCFGLTEGEFDPILNNRNPNNLDDKNLFRPMSELSEDNYLKFREFLNDYVFKYLKSNYPDFISNGNSNTEFLKETLVNILNKVREENLEKENRRLEEERKAKEENNKKYKPKKTFCCDEVIFDDNMSFNDIIASNKGLVGSIKFSSYFDVYNVINSTYLIKKNFEKYFDFTSKLAETDRLDEMAIYDEQHVKIDKARNDILNKLEKTKEQLSIRRLNHYLHELSYVIEVKDDVVFPHDKFVPIEKVVKRFKLLFPKIMDMNCDTNITVSSTNFSCQNYSEQIVIVKRILEMLYPDLSHENCTLPDEKLENSDDNEKKNDKGQKDKSNLYSAVENRINTYPLKDKESGEYCIGFTFFSAANSNEGTISFIYIPSKNELRRRNPIEDMKRYWIASYRFNDKLQNKVEQAGMLDTKKENIEEEENKAKERR